MKDKKYKKENVKDNVKNPRVYYDNYLTNIQEIFSNKGHDKTKGMLISSKNSHKPSTSRFEPTLKGKNETSSIIHSKLGKLLI